MISLASWSHAHSKGLSSESPPLVMLFGKWECWTFSAESCMSAIFYVFPVVCYLLACCFAILTLFFGCRFGVFCIWLPWKGLMLVLIACEAPSGDYIVLISSSTYPLVFVCTRLLAAFTLRMDDGSNPFCYLSSTIACCSAIFSSSCRCRSCSSSNLNSCAF